MREQRDDAIVFVTYAREDGEFVRRLRTALEGDGVQLRGDWLLPAGEGYKEQLRQLIIGSDALLFLVSPHSVVSPACAVELRIAHEQNKRLLPVVYKPVDDPAVPEPLRDPQWISIDDGAGFSAAVGSLVQAINTNFEFLPEFRRLAVAAEIWSKSERGRDDLLRGDALKRARRWRAAVTARNGKLPQPTAAIKEYIAESERQYIRRRRLLLAVAVTGTIVLAAVAFQASNITDFIHSLFVSRTIDRVVASDANLSKSLGAPRALEFYCTYFQAFTGGRVFYLAERKAWVFPGGRFRQSFLLANGRNSSGLTPWYFVQERLESLRDKNEYRQLLDDPKKGAQLNFAVQRVLDRNETDGLFLAPESRPAGAYWVEGGIARVYATYNLDRYFGRPFINECYSTLLLRVYENGYVLGGAPVEHCRDVQGLYVLVKDNDGKGIDRGHWIDRNEFPDFVGGHLKSMCEKGKGYEQW